MQAGSLNSISYLPVRGGIAKHILAKITRTQTKSIEKQYNEGITSFDICLRFDDIYDEPILCDPRHNLDYDVSALEIFETLNQIALFHKESHPKENVYVRVQYKDSFDNIYFKEYINKIHSKFPLLRLFGGDCCNCHGMRDPEYGNPKEYKYDVYYTDNTNLLSSRLLNRKERNNLSEEKALLYQNFV